MKLVEKGNVKYFVFESFEKTNIVNHCFSTRYGGVSKGCFSEMNLGLHRNDDINCVKENYKIICDAIGADYKKTVLGNRLIHSDEIHKVTSDDVGKGFFKKNDLDGFDGFVTDIKGAVISTTHADCTPIFFLDKVKNVIGVCHAGWRGTVKGIAGKMVKTMVKEFNSNFSDIIAGIAPSIGICCFEVGKEVRDEFINRYDFSSEYIEKYNEKYKIDLKGINYKILLKAGLKRENIEIAQECTMCNDIFFSHRRMGENRGNMSAIISLKE